MFPFKIWLKLGGSVEKKNVIFAELLDINLENNLEISKRHIKAYRNKRNVKSRTKILIHPDENRKERLSFYHIKTMEHSKVSG